MHLEPSLTFHDGLDHEPSAFTILIVDSDSETTRHLVQIILGPRGYKTIVVRTGRRALVTVRRTHVDLILLNWQLRDMEGGELLQTLAGSGRRSPSIVMATAGSEHIAVKAFQLGARGFLSKPLDVDDTIRAIRQVLTEGWGRRRDTRLIESMRRRLQRFVVLQQVVHPIISLRRSHGLSAQIVDAAILVTGAEEGYLFLQQEGTQVLELRAMRLSGQETTQLVRYPAGETPARQVMLTLKPLIMDRDDWGQTGEGYSVKSAIHVPLKTPGRFLGVLSVDRKDSEEPFSSEDEEMLLQLASYVAIALDNSQLSQKANQEQDSKYRPMEEDLGQVRQCIPEQDRTQHQLIGQPEELVEQIDSLEG